MSATDNLTEQFKTSTKLKSLIDGLLEPATELDTALTSLLNDRNLNNATGVNLDRLGEIIGITRQGLDDASYRALLRIQVFINATDTTRPYLIQALEQLTGGEIISHTLYGGGLQYLTSGSGFVVIGDTPVISELLELSDGSTLVLEDDSDFAVLSNISDQRLVISFLKDLIAYGVGYINFGFTDGRQFSEMFGFNSDTPDNNTLLLDNDDELELTGGNILTLPSSEGTVEDPFNFMGFSEPSMLELELDNEDLLELDNGDTLLMQSLTIPDGGGALSEGYVDRDFI